VLAGSAPTSAEEKQSASGVQIEMWMKNKRQPSYLLRSGLCCPHDRPCVPKPNVRRQAKIFGSVFLTFGEMAVLGGWAEGEAPVVVLPWGVFALLGIWMLVRGSRMGVEADDSGVAIINLWRIHRHSWDEIDRFQTDWRNGPRPHVVLRDGTKTRPWVSASSFWRWANCHGGNGIIVMPSAVGLIRIS
jgi:hypothetical protein